MDHRLPLSVAASATTSRPRPLPPQRAVSGSALYFGSGNTGVRPNLPSHLSHVRSVSQPQPRPDETHAVDLTPERTQDVVGRNHGVFSESEEAMVGSPEVIGVEDDEEADGRPRKRLKVERDHGLQPVDERQTGMAHKIVAGEQLPSLPKPNASNVKAAFARRRRNAGKATTRRANGLEPPPTATRLPPPQNAADFCPWTGNHPEDVLNETVVKGGYCDKPTSTNQVECNSAKPIIWHNLSTKNSACLQMLSYLLTQVLERRQTMGKCTAPSTFKPPPRVTVTDTKREAWLRDLANPDVPLRKQSRTIPHGIRGKLLMDQCLAKGIPMHRAVWLAKCVGANELRAFRRKGVSGAAAATGETKWVREWTLSVQQFLEGIVATCGEQDWQTNMNYAVRLATAFYAEQLLDRDHYLDWVVASFAEAGLERLPIWILVLQIYWKDIVRFIRRGRKLGLAILERLQRLSEDESNLNEVLKTRLQKLVAILAVTSRGCLVIPEEWEKYKGLLSPDSLAITQASLRPIGESLVVRNQRLVNPKTVTPANTRSPVLRLYDILDTVGLNIDHEALVSTCLDIVPAIRELVNALLDWAASRYRRGNARVYLTTQLIAALRKRGHDTDSAILAYVAGLETRPALQVENVYTVVGELVRLNAFSVGPYLQWLISSGALYEDSSSRTARDLLAALPESSLSGHVAGLRRTLLSRLGSAQAVDEAATPIIAALDTELLAMNENLSTLLEPSASLGIKVAVAEHARTLIPSPDGADGTSLPRFQLLRTTLESAGDISGIADLVMTAAKTNDMPLLATIVDTVTVHAETFAAMGQLRAITDDLFEQYRILRSNQPLDRTFILALTRSIGLLHQHHPSLDLLKEDLVICEHQNTAIVCSPASDSLIGMSATSLESDQDIHAVFASGNSMDDQLLQRVFMRVLQRAGKRDADMTASTSKLCSWLNQLRVVGGASFDELVMAYFQSALKTSHDSAKGLSAIIALVASDCVNLLDILRLVGPDSEAHAIRFVVRPLLESANASSGLSTTEQYRYRAICQSCYMQHGQMVASLLMAVCDDPHLDVNKDQIHDMIIAYTVTQVDSLGPAFHDFNRDKTSSPKTTELSQALLACGIAPSDSSPLDLRRIVAMSDPLSVRFCVGALRQFARGNTNEGDSMKDVMIEAIQSGNSVWPQLVGQAISDNTKRELHNWAQDQALRSVGSGSAAQENTTKVMLERCLDVLDLTYDSVKEDDDTHVLGCLHDKLQSIERQLTHGVDPGQEASDTIATLSQELGVLLHICCRHIRSSEFCTEANRQACGNLLMVLCSLFTHPHLQMQRDLAEYVFDITSSLGETLPEAATQSIARLLKTPDSRLQAILGISTSSADAWLALASSVHHPPAIAQQRAAAKHIVPQGSTAAARPNVVGGTHLGSSQPTQAPQRLWPAVGNHRVPAEVKMAPFALRRWEVIPDSTPVMGENDTSLSLGLFGARKV